GGDGVGRVALSGPAVPEHDVAGDGVGGAAGEPPGVQVPQAGQDDVAGGALGGGGDHHAHGPAPGHDVTQQGDELVLPLFGADGGAEVGDLVDGAKDRGEHIRRGDLAAFAVGQVRVPVVDHGLEFAEGEDRGVQIGADEHVGDPPPQPEF